MMNRRNDKVRTADGCLVTAYSIIGTDILCFAAYESYNGHSVLFHDEDGKAYGQIKSRRLPKELEALPALTDERYNKVMAFINKNKQEEQALIESIFPEAKNQ